MQTYVFVMRHGNPKNDTSSLWSDICDNHYRGHSQNMATIYVYDTVKEWRFFFQMFFKLVY